ARATSPRWGEVRLWHCPASISSSLASIDDLRHARQEQAIDREVCRDVAKLAQRVDHLGDLGLGDLAGLLEQFLAAKEIVGLVGVFDLRSADLGQDLDRLGAVPLVIEPRDGLARCDEETPGSVWICRRPAAVHGHAGKW